MISPPSRRPSRAKKTGHALPVNSRIDLLNLLEASPNPDPGITAPHWRLTAKGRIAHINSNFKRKGSAHYGYK
jgi:hypothetical protein